MSDRESLLLPAPISVWAFEDAPPGLQALSRHGGNEDWLALVTQEYAVSRYIPWLDTGSFGVCDISEHTLPDGHVVYIGAHA
jgi:hypothetical protein